MICPFLYELRGFHLSWDFSVGGIRYPKHFGQSGHPIPLPVIRTIDPAVMTKYTKDKLRINKNLYGFFIRF